MTQKEECRPEGRLNCKDNVECKDVQGEEEQEQSTTSGEPATKACGQGIPALVADRASKISTGPKGGEQSWMLQEPGSPHSPACTLAGWTARSPGAAEVLRGGRTGLVGTVEGGDLDCGVRYWEP